MCGGERQESFRCRECVFCVLEGVACRVLPSDEFDAAVPVPAFLGRVVGDGSVFAVPCRLQSVGEDAVRDEPVNDCLGALEG